MKSVPVEELRNIGPTSAKWLRDIGVKTKADIKRQGIVPIYVKLKKSNPRVSLNMLWALFGAMTDRHYLDIPQSVKDKIIKEIRQKLN